MTIEADRINAWFDDEEIKKLCDPTTLQAPKSKEEFLRNRIWIALREGIKMGRDIQKKEDIEKLCRVLY